MNNRTKNPTAMQNRDKPAYPDNENIEEVGISKREYFAAMALSGLISIMEHGDKPADIACAAVGIADALLTQLEKQ